MSEDAEFLAQRDAMRAACADDLRRWADAFASPIGYGEPLDAALAETLRALADSLTVKCTPHE